MDAQTFSLSLDCLNKWKCVLSEWVRSSDQAKESETFQAYLGVTAGSGPDPQESKSHEFLVSSVCRNYIYTILWSQVCQIAMCQIMSIPYLSLKYFISKKCYYYYLSLQQIIIWGIWRILGQTHTPYKAPGQGRPLLCLPVTFAPIDFMLVWGHLDNQHAGTVLLAEILVGSLRGLVPCGKGASLSYVCCNIANI